MAHSDAPLAQKGFSPHPSAPLHPLPAPPATGVWVEEPGDGVKSQNIKGAQLNFLSHISTATSVVFEAPFKKSVTYTCTTDEVVASWSAKATPEERPVKLSPRTVMMGESGEDKSSFISSGHSGSGLGLASISGTPSVTSSICRPLERRTKEQKKNYGYNIQF